MLTLLELVELLLLAMAVPLPINNDDGWLLPPQRWQQHVSSTLLVLVPLLFLLLVARRRARQSLRLPPGPPRLPILGNLHQLIGALPHQSLRALARRHGPDVMLLRLGAVPTLVVSSAAAARVVMRTRDADCCSRPDTAGARRLSYGHKDVAFAPYSEYWRSMRKLFVVELLSARRVHGPAACHAREAEVAKLVNRLTIISAGERKPLCLEDHVFALMDGVVGTVALGHVYGADRFASGWKRFRDVLDEAMHAKASFFSFEDYFPGYAAWLVDRLVTGAAARRERVFKDLDAFFDLVVDQHLLVDPSARGTSPEADLVDVMVGIMKREQEQEREGSSPGSFTRDHIKGLLSNVFSASIDTSSVTMIWAMAELVRKPALLARVQHEIRAAVGPNRAAVHHDDVPKLGGYLKKVVKETLRLHPAVPLLLPRETLRDVEICGYHVPAGTRLFVNAWAIGRDPAIWGGDDADEFDPDRFDEKKDVDFNGTCFEFVPFGAGRRMCPGMAMGVATMEFALANLLYCFDWALPDGVRPEDVSMEEAGGLTVHKKVPLVLVPTRHTWERQNTT